MLESDSHALVQADRLYLHYIGFSLPIIAYCAILYGIPKQKKTPDCVKIFIAVTPYFIHPANLYYSMRNAFFESGHQNVRSLC